MRDWEGRWKHSPRLFLEEERRDADGRVDDRPGKAARPKDINVLRPQGEVLLPQCLQLLHLAGRLLRSRGGREGFFRCACLWGGGMVARSGRPRVPVLAPQAITARPLQLGGSGRFGQKGEGRLRPRRDGGDASMIAPGGRYRSPTSRLCAASPGQRAPRKSSGSMRGYAVGA